MRKAEIILIVFVLLLSSGALVGFFPEDEISDVSSGGQGIQILWTGIYALTAVFLVSRNRRAVALIAQDRILWLLVGLALCSVAWSAVPTATIRRGVALFGTTIFGLYLAARSERLEIWRLLLYALWLGVLISFSFTFFFPDYGVQEDVRYTEVWRGAFVQKNSFGCLMALTTIFSVLHSSVAQRHRIWILGLASLSGLLVLFSGSLTALFVLLIFLGFFLLHIVFHVNRMLRSSFAVVIIMIGVPTTYWLFAHLEQVLDLFGRDLTLTGRTELWSVVWEMIMDRPWLGYGYGAFWLGWNGPSAEVWSLVWWEAPHAHNGFLDLWLQLGVVGVGLFTCHFASNLRRAWIFFQQNKDLRGLFPLTFLLFLVLYNFNESTILTRNSLFWIFYVFISVQLHQELVKKAPDFTLESLRSWRLVKYD